MKKPQMEKSSHSAMTFNWSLSYNQQINDIKHLLDNILQIMNVNALLPTKDFKLLWQPDKTKSS
jgi:hypothetical protein